MGKCNQAWNLLKGAYTHLRANNMTPEWREKLLAGRKDGSIIPYLGAGGRAETGLADLCPLGCKAHRVDVKPRGQ